MLTKNVFSASQCKQFDSILRTAVDLLVFNFVNCIITIATKIEIVLFEIFLKGRSSAYLNSQAIYLAIW